MDVRQKLQILADAAKDDASCASSGGQREPAPLGGLGRTAFAQMGEPRCG
jgi:predicted DNA-binding helix-hairpin-helix protein